MRELFDTADFVVVGTGAGGATAARVLSDAGHSVIMLEEGPHLVAGADEPLLTTMGEAMREFGAQATSGSTPMPLLQGSAVGGSTVINSGIIWRMPDDVRRNWDERHGLGTLVSGHALDDAFTQIEAELDVAPVADSQLGGNGRLMRHAAEALGLRGQPMLRNARTCQGSARCLQGCPNRARQSMDASYVPRALSCGARLHVMARAQRIVIERGVAKGVTGDLIDPETRRAAGRFTVLGTRGVIVAAGAVHTPTLLLRSGIRGAVGRRFQAHPGAAVVGRFPFAVEMARGASQAFEVPMRDVGVKLESLSLPPELLAARVPGAGAAWRERLSTPDHFAQWCALVRMEAVGSVRRGLFGEPVVRYQPTPRDLRRTQDAVALLCRMMFAGGATEVYPGLSGLPDTLRNVREVEQIERATVPRAGFHLLASHLFGSAWAGADAAASVVGPDLAAHAVSHLHVMDASVFPTNLGVNPQHSIMGVVWVAAERLANQARRRLAA